MNRLNSTFAWLPPFIVRKLQLLWSGTDRVQETTCEETYWALRPSLLPLSPIGFH